MSVRDLLLLVLGAPVLVVAGALAMGQTIPVPIFGRDYVLSFPVSETPIADRLPGVYGPEDPSTPLVGMDAGHGGRDPGAVGGGVMEKVVVLAIALQLRDILVEQGGVRVALTREDDRIIP